MLHILLVLFLIGYIVHVCLQASSFEKAGGIHQIFVPVYSIFLFFLTVRWNTEDVVLMILLVPVALLIGKLQSSRLVFDRSYSPTRNTYTVTVQKNWPFVVGWILVLAIGILLEAWMSRDNISDLLTTALVDDFLEELDPLTILKAKHTWYIWLLSGISSLTFHLIAHKKAKEVKFSADQYGYGCCTVEEAEKVLRKAGKLPYDYLADSSAEKQTGI